MLNNKNFILKSRTPGRSPKKQWWTFIHKNNPTHVELVHQYTNGKISGKEYFIRELTQMGVIDLSYVPSKQFLKKYEDTVERNQSGLQMGFKGFNTEMA